MKNSTTLFSTLVIIALFFYACTSGMKGNLCKKWMIDSSSIQDSLKAGKAKLDAQLKSFDDSITAAGSDSAKVSILRMEKNMSANVYESSSKMMSSMDSMMKTMYMEFDKDGSYKYNMMGKVTSGKWTLDEGNKTIVTKGDVGDADTMNIVMVSADKLTLNKGKDSEDKMSFVPFK